MSFDTDKIRDIWQPASARPLTREDSREIASNVVGFFELLAKWEEQDRLLGGTPNIGAASAKSTP
ncbi:MAG: hypothetical protein JWM80_3294 [Cyanobacteria bacterium RYN_339]|nr:hypothetical protein [Cyanobacteria bacterium RYN_339]